MMSDEINIIYIKKVLIYPKDSTENIIHIYIRPHKVCSLLLVSKVQIIIARVVTKIKPYALYYFPQGFSIQIYCFFFFFCNIVKTHRLDWRI